MHHLTSKLSQHINPNQTSQSPPETLETFTARMRHEFVEGSSISPDLFATSVRLTRDLEFHAGGEVSTPIHDALGWRYVRFGNTANATLFAALLQNEDGSVWQAKLSQPKWDQQKNKQRKYETPIGNGSRAWLPAITVGTWRAIAQRYDLEIAAPWQTQSSPEQQRVIAATETFCTSLLCLIQTLMPCVLSAYRSRLSDSNMVLNLGTSIYVERLADQAIVPNFWHFIASHPEIPVVLTEGGKKAASLLSQGYVAIALYGVNGGYRTKDSLGNTIDPYLVEDVARFATLRRSFILAFDQDEQDKTRRKVNIALNRLGRLLRSATGIDPKIVRWDAQQGKGVDDLIVGRGIQAWESALAEALPLEHWLIWQHLEHQLTYPTNLQLTTHDLSTLNLDLLPNQGIVAIASGKGTGKTKFIANSIQSVDRVLGAGHRVALMRNLCRRLQLDYRGDLDKVGGQFINGAGYALRIGFCVDSLLAIDPEQFMGCDLILDEVVQVLRHLIGSSTCAKDGKRPVLLSRFAALVRNAKRIIAADADLDNASLNYLRELRGEHSEVFLIRNDYKPETHYTVDFIECPDRSVSVAKLMVDAKQLQPGKLLLVATDSKRTAKTLTHQLQKQNPEMRILTIHSETSGCEVERAFIESPDQVLERGEFDIIITSPSMATGVSIESQGYFEKVYGIFHGVSSTDADMAQALDRVREPVPRVVWCAPVGTNYSPVGRSTNRIELKRRLQDQTSATISLIRSSLNADSLGAIAQYDWQSDPHVNLWSKMSAEQNRAMGNLRMMLLVRLKYEGKQVVVETAESNEAVKELLRVARDQVIQQDAMNLVDASILSIKEVLLLEAKETTSPEESRAIARFYLCEFYGIAPDHLTLEDVLADKEGRRRAELLSLEAQVYRGVAVDRIARSLEKQAAWNQGLCPWDLSKAELRRKLRELIGLEAFLDPTKVWTQYDVAGCAQRARQFAPQIKQLLNFTISIDADGNSAVSDVQIVHQLLRQIGVEVYRPHQGDRAEYPIWSNKVEGHEGEKLRLYRIDPRQWQWAMQILERRRLHRESFAQKEGQGSPAGDVRIDSKTGDLSLHVDLAIIEWLTPEVFQDVRALWESAEHHPEAIQALKEAIPNAVLQWAIAG
jgi:hypothetical protein